MFKLGINDSVVRSTVRSGEFSNNLFIEVECRAFASHKAKLQTKSAKAPTSKQAALPKQIASAKAASTSPPASDDEWETFEGFPQVYVLLIRAPHGTKQRDP